MRIPIGISIVLLAVMVVPAVAQQRPAPARQPATKNRVFVEVNGLLQAGVQDFDQTVTFQKNAESGSFSADYDVKSAPAFNVSGGSMLTERFGVAVGVSRFSRSTPSTFSASVPHPFVFNQPRSVSGDIGGLTREELALHVQARLVVPVSRRLEGMVFGGPSFFQVKQDLVDDFTLTETYPYDTATFNQGITSTAKKSKIGFNVGADVSYFFSRQVGLGGTAQYATASIDLSAAGGTTTSVKVGGLQVGGGLRLRF